MESFGANALRKIIHAATVLALLTCAASAQMVPGIDLAAPNVRHLSPEEQEKQKVIDDAYKSAIRKIPDQQKPTDPWGNIRPNPNTPPNVKKRQQ